MCLLRSCSWQLELGLSSTRLSSQLFQHSYAINSDTGDTSIHAMSRTLHAALRKIFSCCTTSPNRRPSSSSDKGGDDDTFAATTGISSGSLAAASSSSSSNNAPGVGQSQVAARKDLVEGDAAGSVGSAADASAHPSHASPPLANLPLESQPSLESQPPLLLQLPTATAAAGKLPVHHETSSSAVCPDLQSPHPTLCSIASKPTNVSRRNFIFHPAAANMMRPAAAGSDTSSGPAAAGSSTSSGSAAGSDTNSRPAAASRSSSRPATGSDTNSGPSAGSGASGPTVPAVEPASSQAATATTPTASTASTEQPTPGVPAAGVPAAGVSVPSDGGPDDRLYSEALLAAIRQNARKWRLARDKVSIIHRCSSYLVDGNADSTLKISLGDVQLAPRRHAVSGGSRNAFLSLEASLSRHLGAAVPAATASFSSSGRGPAICWPAMTGSSMAYAHQLYLARWASLLPPSPASFPAAAASATATLPVLAPTVTISSSRLPRRRTTDLYGDGETLQLPLHNVSAADLADVSLPAGAAAYIRRNKAQRMGDSPPAAQDFHSLDSAALSSSCGCLTAAGW